MMVTHPQDDPDITTGDGLAARRRALGLTQIQLANAAGCSTSMLERLEAGYRPTTGRSHVLARVSAALDEAEARR